MPRRANALNINTYVAGLDKDATKRTQADFSSVVEIRPISGPAGIKKGLVIVDAGNAGDFDFVWLKDAKSGKILGVANKKAPPPMIVKADAERGSFVRPMAYSEKAGLWEGDPFLVEVGEFMPRGSIYEERPEGPISVFGSPLYRK